MNIGRVQGFVQGIRIHDRFPLLKLRTDTNVFLELAQLRAR
jgi:hypothetical protein